MKYVYNALAPAEVSMVIVDDEKKCLLVVVPDDQLSLAIGRQGQNVRLASRLLGWRIDVKSESRYANSETAGYRELLTVEGVDESLADRLFGAGITSVKQMVEADAEKLAAAIRMDLDKTMALQLMAAQAQLQQDQQAEPATDEAAGTEGTVS